MKRLNWAFTNLWVVGWVVLGLLAAYWVAEYTKITEVTLLFRAWVLAFIVLVISWTLILSVFYVLALGIITLFNAVIPQEQRSSPPIMLSTGRRL